MGKMTISLSKYYDNELRKLAVKHKRALSKEIEFLIDFYRNSK